ncbi:MAG: aminomethyl-transferring glycine dehydrogenase subunit GcvPB [Planctomycetota bacterium]
MKNTRDTKSLFELSKPGRRATRLPVCDVPEQAIEDLLPPSALAERAPELPELSEPQVVRHFLNLSTQNMSVDTHFYPLGSCTMKHNPKRNERAAAMPGFADLHPYQPEESLQGMLQVLYEMQEYLSEISGLPACSLQPAAGAHGELTALWVAAAYFRDQGTINRHRKVLVPDSAHGTNPASAVMAGFEVVTVKTTVTGAVDMDDFHAKLDDHVAVFMITNPNTVGIFEPSMREIADEVHARGGLIYLDGANMNAILGVTRAGDFGADMQHYNPHKTFSGPHGGGGPGAGPICVTEELRPYLPAPVVAKVSSGQRVAGSSENGGIGAADGPLPTAHYHLDFGSEKSLGRVRSFFGNVGVLLRAYCYIRTHGPDGLRRVSEHAVLNANYLLSRVKHFLPVPQGDRCMHEFVATVAPLKAAKGVTAMDLAKRLLDYGFHAPTVYFPLTVKEAFMIEPTETESKETLDAFAEVLFRVTEEEPDVLHAAPHSTAISRPDEVAAARKPVMCHCG